MQVVPLDKVDIIVLKVQLYKDEKTYTTCFIKKSEFDKMLQQLLKTYLPSKITMEDLIFCILSSPERNLNMKEYKSIKILR